MYGFTVDLFEGRCVVVTGAARGIGRATALAFAEHGAALVLVDRDLVRIHRRLHSLIELPHQDLRNSLPAMCHLT